MSTHASTAPQKAISRRTAARRRADDLLRYAKSHGASLTPRRADAGSPLTVVALAPAGGHHFAIGVTSRGVRIAFDTRHADLPEAIALGSKVTVARSGPVQAAVRPAGRHGAANEDRGPSVAFIRLGDAPPTRRKAAGSLRP